LAGRTELQILPNSPALRLAPVARDAPIRNQWKYRFGLSFNEVFDEHNCLPSRTVFTWLDFARQDLSAASIARLKHDGYRPTNRVTTQNKKAGRKNPDRLFRIAWLPSWGVVHPYVAVGDV